MGKWEWRCTFRITETQPRYDLERVLGVPPTETEPTRTDYYVLLNASAGLKVRDGKLELKLRADVDDSGAELWNKYQLDLPAHSFTAASCGPLLDELRNVSNSSGEKILDKKKNKYKPALEGAIAMIQKYQATENGCSVNPFDKMARKVFALPNGLKVEENDVGVEGQWKEGLVEHNGHEWEIYQTIGIQAKEENLDVLKVALASGGFGINQNGTGGLVGSILQSTGVQPQPQGFPEFVVEKGRTHWYSGELFGVS